MPFNFDTLFYDDYYGGVKWAAPGQNVTVTWSLVSDNIIVPGVAGEISVNEPDNATIAVYQQAFKLWDDALDTLTFQQNSNGNSADVAVGIVDYLTSDGYWNSSWDSGIIYNSSIRLDKDILATPNLLTTLLHEIGNVLGLGDIRPSSTIRSLQEDPFPEDFTGSSLWPDDIAMIKQLYEEPIIIETDAPPPSMTYIVPTSGANINHTGTGAIVNANVDVSSSSDAILVNNNGTGSTTVTTTGTFKGGVGVTDQTRDIDGIWAWNDPTAKDLSITILQDTKNFGSAAINWPSSITGLDDGIVAINKGTGFLSISVTGDVTSTSTDKSDTDFSYGIYADNYGTDLTVGVNGDVTANDKGLFVWNDGSGQTSVTSEGTVTALNATAIYAENVETSTASDIIISAKNANGFDEGIMAINHGSGSTTITATGAVKGGVGRNETTTGINPAGISAVNGATATNLTITAKDVSGQGYGIYAENLGTGANEISVSGVIVGSGTESKGIYTKGSGATITVLTSASVSGTDEGIKTGNTADTLTINGSVTGLNGTAILLGSGNDTINLGTTATITGAISGGIGSDTANFFVAKSAVDTFTYDNTAKTAVVTISGKATSFIDFEAFKFVDVSSGMTAEEAVSTFAVSDSPAKSIGSLADQTVKAGVSLNLSEILSSTNADGGSYSWINVYDATGGNNFVKNGVEIDASAGAWVSLSDLANTIIKGDNQASEQTLWFQTYEGGIYSAWESLVFTTTGSAPAFAQPVGSIADQTVAAGSSVNLSEILSSTNADGGIYSWFNVYDATGENNFVKNGVEIIASAGAWLSSSDLANTTIKGDNQESEQTLYFQTYDGAAYSAWDSMILTTSVEI